MNSYCGVMNIQTKAILIITSVFITLIFAFAVITRTLIANGFLQLERSYVQDDTRRVHNMLELEQDNLKRLVIDWAIWDDAYVFLQNRNTSFAQSNLSEPTYPTNDVDVIVYMKNTGEAVFAKQYNEETEELENISAELLKHFQQASPFIQLTKEEEAFAGFISTSNDTYLLAVSPVLKTDSSGVARGVMMMAKKVDEDFIDSLHQLLDLKISLFKNQQIQEDINSKLIKQVSLEEGFHQEIVDEENISGYGLAKDLYGNPVILYRVDLERAVYQQGVTTSQYLVYAMIIAALIFAVIMTVLVRKLVMNKISDITRNLKKMQNDFEFAGRLEELGQDEIGDLSHTINDVLESFNKTAQDLGNAKELAERNNSAKTEFLSQLSHELRTPLNAILGFAQLSSLESMTPTNRENVEQILHAGQHLLGLIDELLDLSKLELGRYEIRKECVKVNDTVNDAISMVNHIAAEYSIGIVKLCSAMEGVFVDADCKRLRQVLVNLLSNAIKYNRENGTIWVDCEKVNDSKVLIKVRDKGQGIAADMQDKIFEPYERGNVKQLSIPGSGIGLYLSKQLIEAMSGKIGVESLPGKGSTFWIELNIYNP